MMLWMDGVVSLAHAVRALYILRGLRIKDALRLELERFRAGVGVTLSVPPQINKRKKK